MSRFEPDGDGFIFRENLRSPGISVSRLERDRFISEYAKRADFSVTGFTALTIAIIFASALLLPGFLSEQTRGVISLALAMSCFPALVAYSRWIWDAPTRALKGRPPVRAARSREEASQIKLQRTTWVQLTSPLIIAASIFVYLFSQHVQLASWLWLLPAIAVWIVLFVAVQALRKWNADRRKL